MDLAYLTADRRGDVLKEGTSTGCVGVNLVTASGW